MIRFTVILILSGLLAGCASDPLSGVPRLSDTDVSGSEIQAALREDADPSADDAPALSEPQTTGFFGRLFGRAAAGPDEETVSAEDPAESVEPEMGASVPERDAEADATVETAVAEPPRRGLLGFLSRAARSAQTEGGTQLAAAPPQTDTDAAAPARGGPSPDAPDYRIVPIGTVLPYGVLARVCDVPNRRLGTRVERYPERGSGYEIYDSEPGNTGPHTFYVTGFDDGCARQFTAALAMFGSPETHERLRYGLPSKVQPYSSTDAAYETLKSRVCRVGKGKPCGSSMSRLARNTAFVSVYERFGSNPVWKTILLHDGKVIETDIRGN
ncbi:hypothetical protein [Marivita sp. XM-24bin2]|jgi:hypothetical protein|uniref:hypothetical protein n=1 Tax=unclassified Marivita TaxID=2632480 RepID=UPI000D79D937|nr:hypothetical protein [Marivita sp. XM-24bin2]MCR9110637.1 hypothetical protein [Paracoccaceae bacterium]PWL33915.1 MAG: hypothetical protein DCO97_17065 [Marivita sp. XM-24bin2]